MSDFACPMPHFRDPEKPRSPEPGALLCHGHIAQSRQALERLPVIYEQLAAVAVPSGQRSSGPRSSEKPIPYRAKAADLRQLIRATVVAQARNVAEERGAMLPDGNGYDDVPQACAFLRRHHDWTVGQLWADDYATELHDLERAAQLILIPTHVRRFTHDTMRCVELHELSLPDGNVEIVRCTGQLWSTLRDSTDYLPSKIECDVCGHTVTADRWVTYGRKVQKTA